MVVGIQFTYYDTDEELYRTVSFGELRGTSTLTKFNTDVNPVQGLYGTYTEYGISSLGWIYYDIECKEIPDSSGFISGNDLNDGSELNFNDSLRDTIDER